VRSQGTGSPLGESKFIHFKQFPWRKVPTLHIFSCIVEQALNQNTLMRIGDSIEFMNIDSAELPRGSITSDNRALIIGGLMMRQKMEFSLASVQQISELLPQEHRLTLPGK